MLPTFVADVFRSAPGRVLTTAQLGAIGVPCKWVLALVEEGLVERMLFGVYRDPTAEPPPTQCLHVVRAYLEQRRPDGCPPEVFSGEAALGAREVEGFPLPCAPLVLMDGARHIRRARAEFTTLRTDMSRIPAEDVAGLLLATVIRSLADAANTRHVTEAQLRVGIDDLRNRWMLDIVDAVAFWAALPHDGARRLTRMAEEGAFEQESEAERDAFRRLFVNHPPAPDCQVHLTPSIRVDFVFLSAALVIEYHGGVHDRSVDQDATRIWALRRLGYEVIVVTRSMMRDHAALAAEIQAIRMEREHLVRAGHLRRPLLPPQPARLSPLRTIRPAA
ncbi:MAG TPA: DUF559 domain-containing protein [Euzebya sp.]|nr:DUF559 domain-containing protein [Euzebya sp.]